MLHLKKHKYLTIIRRVRSLESEVSEIKRFFEGENSLGNTLQNLITSINTIIALNNTTRSIQRSLMEATLISFLMSLFAVVYVIIP